MSKIYSVLHFCSPFFWRRSRIHLPALLAQGILNWTSPDSQVSLPPYPRARTTLFLKLSCLSELSHPLRPSSIPLSPLDCCSFQASGWPVQRRKHSCCPYSWPYSRVSDPKWAPCRLTSILVPETLNLDTSLKQANKQTKPLLKQRNIA